ncbi:substance-K receptor-like [Stylophora pistillata]|uniref:substance-K receptor-like n=1 Tax=Stylophora pistillata TaxID=50429 RepID=UPI000C039BA5|nr:substance-K receptor-like [Stylophora pistillata]
MNSSFLENSTFANATEASKCIPFRKEDSVSVKATKAACFTVLLLFSIFGNAAVIAIVAKTRLMQTTTNYLIANMAASDLLLSTFAVPRELAEIFIGFRGWLFHGLFGAILCKLVYFFQDISTAVSIQSIVFITLDRYTGVVAPFRKPFITPRRRKMVMVSTWLIAMSLHAIYLYIYRVERANGANVCFVNFDPGFDNLQGLRINFIILTLFLIVIPLRILIVLYSLIFKALEKQKSFWRKCSSSLLKSRQKENTEVIKKILVIISLFLICILPMDIVGLLFLFAWHEGIPCGMDNLSFAVKFIFYSNASLNPCFYFILNNRYRQGLRNLFKGHKGLVHERQIKSVEMTTY